jgi:hypothetical protein
MATAAASPRLALAHAPSTIIVPFHIRDGRVLLDISLNGGPQLPFILDTGGVVSLIRRDVAQAAGLQQVGTLRLETVGGYGGADPREGYEAKEVLIGGTARRRSMVFAGVDPQQIGLAASGSLDGEILTAYDSLLSFQESRWTIFSDGEPDRTGFTHVASAIRQPAKRGSPFLYVDAELDGQPLRLLVDTGAPRSVILQSDAAHRLGFLDEGRRWTPWRVRPGSAPGAIGRETRADRLVIAGQSFAGPIVSLRSNPPVAALADGLLGLGIIQRLDWIVDRATASLWIKPNGRKVAPQSYNRSGVLFAAEANAASVMEVGAGSPADRAGIIRGDRISAKDFSVLQQSLAGPAGTAVTLDVERDGTTKSVAFAIADFL